MDLIAQMAKHASVRQNLAVWSQNDWHYCSVTYVEPLPASSQMVRDFGAAAANATIAQAEVTTFDVDNDNLLQLRFMPIDDVEFILWLTRSQGKFATRGVHTRVSKKTSAADPAWATTEFNVFGRDRNPFIETRNLGDYAIAQARALFWGYKYKLLRLKNVVEREDGTGVMRPYVPEIGKDGERTGRMMPLVTSYADAEGLL